MPIQRPGSSTLYRETIYKTCDITDPTQIEALLDDIKPQTIISCAAPKSAGIPGAGKTMVAAITVDYLLNLVQNSLYGVAFVYCNYKAQAD